MPVTLIPVGCGTQPSETAAAADGPLDTLPDRRIHRVQRIAESWEVL